MNQAALFKRCFMKFFWYLSRLTVDCSIHLSEYGIQRLLWFTCYSYLSLISVVSYSKRHSTVYHPRRCSFVLVNQVALFLNFLYYYYMHFAYIVSLFAYFFIKYFMYILLNLLEKYRLNRHSPLSFKIYNYLIIIMVYSIKDIEYIVFNKVCIVYVY